MQVECSLCGKESELNPDWYFDGVYHICPECVSDILEQAGQVLRSRAPDSVVLAAAINLMDEEGLLCDYEPIHGLKYNWPQVITSAPAEIRGTNAIAIFMSAGIEPVAAEGDTVVFASRYPVHKAIMEQPANQHIADNIMSRFFGRPMHVSWRQSTNCGLVY